MKSRPVFYSCDNCPSYCCTYTEIEVRPEDVERLATHFGMDEDTARLRLTMDGKDPGERVMRHFRDPVFGTACRLLNLETRRCTGYEARPNACRIHPGTPSCHYYQFLMTERRIQGKPELIARAYNLVGSLAEECLSQRRNDTDEGD